MRVVAWIHTEGVLLSNKYYALELAYEDILGNKRLFFIKSPMTYETARKTNPYIDKSCEAIMCTRSSYHNYKVFTFRQVLDFLRKQFYMFGSPDAVFGYKGASFQQDILKKASIPAINLERFKIPAIATLSAYRHPCPFHVSESNKCAAHVLDLIRPFSNSFSRVNSTFFKYKSKTY